MVPCGQVAVYPVVKGLACVYVQVDLDNIFSKVSLFSTLAMLLHNETIHMCTTLYGGFTLNPNQPKNKLSKSPASSIIIIQLLVCGFMFEFTNK